MYHEEVVIKLLPHIAADPFPTVSLPRRSSAALPQMRIELNHPACDFSCLKDHTKRYPKSL